MAKQMLTVRGSWYEVWIKGTLDLKLPKTFSSQREAKAAIKEAVADDKANGRQPREYMLMIADSICTLDGDREVISKTLTYARA